MFPFSIFPQAFFSPWLTDNGIEKFESDNTELRKNTLITDGLMTVMGRFIQIILGSQHSGENVVLIKDSCGTSTWLIKQYTIRMFQVELCGPCSVTDLIAILMATLFLINTAGTFRYGRHSAWTLKTNGWMLQINEYTLEINGCMLKIDGCMLKINGCTVITVIRMDTR
ncbi:uncharacterized protein EV154DRAFT_554149 [Mucor mucedo]|uniref:uncharacterized protein n=1 Tax=Mucor mucedo TaxID=29922 RepID=UPI00221F6DA4|nr:uncharacterized protein EV154DRAFT_554149 [Mucor mucedo]KAI7888058.1 hypothetical protein EV154DRAFT_554149 [Mucor mucedo]